MTYQVEMFRLSNTTDDVVFLFREVHTFVSVDVVNVLTKKLVFFREKSFDYYDKYGVDKVKLVMIPNVPQKYIDNFLNNP